MTRSARAPLVTAALLADPLAGVSVPRVAVVVDRAQCRLDLVPSTFVVEALANQLHDEGTPTSRPGSAVQFDDEIIIELYV